MKTYIRRQQHKNFKHQDIKQKEPPKKVYLEGQKECTRQVHFVYSLVLAILYVKPFSLMFYLSCLLSTTRLYEGRSESSNSPAQNQFDLELWYKVFFFTDSCSLDIAINDSG